MCWCAKKKPFKLIIIIIINNNNNNNNKQGDPLSGVKFCESIQPTLLETEAQTTMGLFDDINLEGELSSVARDIEAIIDSIYIYIYIYIYI